MYVWNSYKSVKGRCHNVNYYYSAAQPTCASHSIPDAFNPIPSWGVYAERFWR